MDGISYFISIPQRKFKKNPTDENACESTYKSKQSEGLICIVKKMLVIENKMSSVGQISMLLGQQFISLGGNVYGKLSQEKL